MFLAVVLVFLAIILALNTVLVTRLGSSGSLSRD